MPISLTSQYSTVSPQAGPSSTLASNSTNVTQPNYPDAPLIPSTSSDDDDEYWSGLKHDEQDGFWDEDASVTGAAPGHPESSDSEQDDESEERSDDGTGSGYWSADESRAESEYSADDRSEHDPEYAEDARSGTGSEPGSESDTSTDNSDNIWDAVHDSECDDDWWEEACVLADAQNDNERDYVVGVGRETGPMSRWYVLSILRNIHTLIYIT